MSRLVAFARLSAAFLTLVGFAFGAVPASGAEGSAAAGPSGGSDIRAALLPPPGLYGALLGVYSTFNKIDDGSGQPAAGLDAVNLKASIGGALLLYVPDIQILGGSIGLLGFADGGSGCGQLISALPARCVTGFGDPYVEADWARFFGHVRPSRDFGAFPIAEGLGIEVGLGAVLPVGQYSSTLQATNGISIGNNTFDLAPSLAITYTTPAILADGTEFSAKIYYNNYSTNPATNYRAGPLVDVDFAVTEHIGRIQVGPTGTYLRQVANDEQNGVAIPPDGRKIDLLFLGGVVSYEMIEYGAVIKLKAQVPVLVENAGAATGVVITLAKKLY